MMNDSAKKTNYHTHTTFCDGKADPETIVRVAIQKRFDILGFSGHSMYPFASDWHIAPREHEAYCAAIQHVAAQYRDSIEIVLGFESDFVDGVCAPDLESYGRFKPDFLIGSVHYVPGSKGFFTADGDPPQVRTAIKQYFNGNTKQAVQAYFSAERDMLRKCSFTFLGHADLIRRQNGPNIGIDPLFNENDSWYRQELVDLANSIAHAGVCVELNMGGMARGIMQSPYPSLDLLELLHERNVPITLNADAHRPETLDYAFCEALLFAKKAGYKELLFFSAGQLHSQNIDVLYNHLFSCSSCC